MNTSPSPLALSVVVPTYRRPELLMQCLQALLAQTLAVDRYEILVVDDGHDEPTRDTVQACATCGRSAAAARRWRATAAGRPPRRR